MMNGDKKFQQRWELRRREVDEEDSLSDEAMDKRHELVTDLVLLENDEANDATRCQRNDNLDTHKSTHKKIEPSKKKNLVQKKSNKKKRNGIAKKMVKLVNLKDFADSLIHELTVARENMIAHMRDEMRKLVPSGPNLEPLKKTKVCPPDGIESMDRNLKSNMLNKFSKAVEEAVEHEKVAEWTATNKLHEDDSLTPPPTGHAILATDADQVAPSSYLTLPSVLPKPQFPNHRNGFSMNDGILAGGPLNNSGSENNFYHQLAEFDTKQGFGSVSHVSSKIVSFLGQNCVQTPGFPVPLHQGMDYGANVSSLTYGENSFLHNIKVCPRMNGSVLRFPLEEKSANNISRNMVRKNAEFEFTRS